LACPGAPPGSVSGPSRRGCFGGATTLTTQLELSVADVDLPIRERVESDARRVPGDEAFEAEHLRGRLDSFEGAVAYALDEPVT
jgi:hypothetical protein